MRLNDGRLRDLCAGRSYPEPRVRTAPVAAAFDVVLVTFELRLGAWRVRVLGVLGGSPESSLDGAFRQLAQARAVPSTTGFATGSGAQGDLTAALKGHSRKEDFQPLLDSFPLRTFSTLIAALPPLSMSALNFKERGMVFLLYFSLNTQHAVVARVHTWEWRPPPPTAGLSDFAVKHPGFRMPTPTQSYTLQSVVRTLLTRHAAGLTSWHGTRRQCRILRPDTPGQYC